MFAHEQMRRMPEANEQYYQLFTVVREACARLGRSPEEVAKAIQSLKEEWVADLNELANLSDAGWRDLRLPTLLKEALRSSCDDLFERVAVPRHAAPVALSQSPCGAHNARQGHRRNGDALVSMTPGRSQIPRHLPCSLGEKTRALTQGRIASAMLPVRSHREEVSQDMAHVLNALRKKIEQSGANSVENIRRRFQTADLNQDGIVDRAEFELLLRELRVPEVSEPAQVQALWNIFDRGNTGFVSYEEFLCAVRWRMNADREAAVRQVFDALDCSREGHADRLKLVMSFDPFPQARETDMSPIDVMHRVLSIGSSENLMNFDDDSSVISQKMLFIYYDNVSAFVNSHADFVRMLRDTWAYVLKGRSTRYTEYEHAYDWAGGARRRMPTESHCRCAAALCERLRKRLTEGSTRCIEKARDTGRLLWQLSHSLSSHGAGSESRQTARRGMLGNSRGLVECLDRSTLEMWIAQLSEGAISDCEKDILFLAMDTDADGRITPADFFRGLRGPIPEGRHQLVDKIFDDLAGGPENIVIKWGKARMPKELLELLGGGAPGSQAISRQEFVDYYLNCWMSLGDHDFSLLVLKDWPSFSGQGADRSPLANLTSGVGESRHAAIMARSFGTACPSPASGSKRPSSAGTHGQHRIKFEEQVSRPAGFASQNLR